VHWHSGKHPHAQLEQAGGGMGELTENQKQQARYEKSVTFVFIENPFDPKMVSLDIMGKLTAMGKPKSCFRECLLASF